MKNLDPAAPISPLRQRLIDNMTMPRFSPEWFRIADDHLDRVIDMR